MDTLGAPGLSPSRPPLGLNGGLVGAGAAAGTTGLGGSSAFTAGAASRSLCNNAYKYHKITKVSIFQYNSHMLGFVNRSSKTSRTELKPWLKLIQYYKKN